jgi:hypothetical protein
MVTAPRSLGRRSPCELIALYRSTTAHGSETILALGVPHAEASGRSGPSSWRWTAGVLGTGGILDAGRHR